MVASGLVTAWRLAICPTSRLPPSTKATMEGVVRDPSLLGITTASPCSITATQLLVVPRSMPMTLPNPLPSRPVARRHRGRHHHHGRTEQPPAVHPGPPVLAHHRSRDRSRRGNGGERLVQRRIEDLAQRILRLHAVAEERLLHLAEHHPHPVGQRVARRRGSERPLQVVDGGEEILHHRTGSGPGRLLPLARHALAEVLEVGGGAQEPIVLRGELALEPLHVGSEVGGGRNHLDRRVASGLLRSLSAVPGDALQRLLQDGGGDIRGKAPFFSGSGHGWFAGRGYGLSGEYVTG